ncbi:MAG: rhomboid family intramembrane serine protease [Planctomycetales bacterium]|nr:rhomboid family intramembrane serine protease [Planctomycetales bacterium]
MGLYDRDYERQQPWRDSYGSGGGGFQLRMPESMVNRIVLVTVAAYLIEVLFFNGQRLPNGYVPNAMIDALGIHGDWYKRPWEVYQLLTYSLVHDNHTVWHIVGNMFGVWMFGRELEMRYGGREFLLYYLGAVLSGGVLVTLYSVITQTPGLTFGASAGTVATVVLYALNYPHRTVLLYFAIPVPMWLVGAFVVGMDLMRALGGGQDHVSWQGHLGGALFAAVYFTQGLRLSDWLPADMALPTLKPKPRLRVHQEDSEESDDEKLAAEVDRILAKINSHGADSLTSREKRLLERASREYKDRRGR